MKAVAARIGLFQPYPHTLGGLQAVVLSLANVLPEFGWDPLIICPEEGKFTEAARGQNLSCVVCDPGAAWRVYGRGSRSLTYLLSPRRVFHLGQYWWKLSRSLRARGVDLLHCNDYRAVMLAAPAARLARIPVLWHMHGYVPSLLANVVGAALVNRTVPVSNGMLQYLRVPRLLLGRIEVIYNGLDTSRNATCPDTATEAALVPVVLGMGTLHPRKDYETLILAFQEVARRLPQAECWIVGGEFGDGSYAAKLREMSARLGLEGRVRFLGRSEEPEKFMRRCAVLAIPSRVEAFGMVAIEAMFAGKPVVACRTGGLQDIIRHGETGLLVPPGDAGAMARALLEILTDQVRARDAGEAGRRRVLEEFTLQKMGRAFAALYRTLLSGGASAPLTSCSSQAA